MDSKQFFYEVAKLRQFQIKMNKIALGGFVKDNMKETIQERVIGGVYHPAIYGNKEANDALNNLIAQYAKKKGYKIYAKAGHSDVLAFTPCSIYVKKYDGRSKKYKPVDGFMKDFRVWFEFYVELAKKADEGVHWKYVQQGKTEILEYHGNTSE